MDIYFLLKYMTDSDSLFSLSTFIKVIAIYFVYTIVNMILGFYGLESGDYSNYAYFYIGLAVAYILLPKTIPHL